MSSLTFGLLLGGLLMAIAAGAIFIAALRAGHFDDIEAVKYQMFRDGEDDHGREKTEP